MQRIKRVESSRLKDAFSEAVHWLFYGIILTIMPLAISFFIDHIFGYPMEKVAYLPDFLLVTFSILSNVLGVLSDDKTVINKYLKRVLLVFNGVVLALYFMFYNILSVLELVISEYNIKGELLPNLNSHSVFVVTIIINVFFCAVGFFTEIYINSVTYDKC